MVQSKLKAGSYCRLSDDDMNDGTSISIETQMTIAKQYCKEHQIQIVDFYCDDGFTGTNFDRPAFKRMLEDLKKGKINTVIVKDLSRFGRESIYVNYYTQRYFPENNITFILISDNTILNANSNYDYMLTLKSAINEIYPAEISQKVRQAFRAKGRNGEFLHPWIPYGYVKSSTDRNHLVIDEEYAPVVVKIFEMIAYKGMTSTKICEYLSQNEIPSPRALRDIRKGKTDVSNPYRWYQGSVFSILNNEVYLGNIIHGKTRKVNFKSKKIIHMDREDWIICENAHEPIISQDLWDAAHLRITGKRKDRKPEFGENLYRSLLYCADCGATMWITAPKNKSVFYVCGNSRKRKTDGNRCTSHNIPLSNLDEAVLKDINSLISEYNIDSDKFKDELLRRVENSLPNVEVLKHQISDLEKRIDRETNKYKKLYDDYYDGMIKSTSLFEKMLDECNEQIESCTRKRDELKSELNSSLNHLDSVDKFMGLVCKVKKVDELNKEILNTIVERIEVGERTRNSANELIQNVRIKYKFIGSVKY